LSGDEAYYWVWSHHLQAGYHDHPPMIALLIAACTRLGGDTVVAVRLAAALCMAGTILLQARLAGRLGGDLAGWLAFLLCLLLPAFEMGFTLATPDDPLAFFWTAGLCFALPALTGDGKWRDFLALGACCGLAMASKYTGVLLPAALIVFVAITTPKSLLSLRLWAAGLVALLVFSPVLWWNAEHGFESLLFQYHHGSGETRDLSLRSFGEFIGGQALVLSPILAILLVYLAARWRRWRADPQQTLLMVCFLLPMAVFFEKALFTKIQLNWALPAYLSVLPLLTLFLLRQNRRLLWIPAALLPALLLTVAIKFPLAVGLSGKNNPHNRLYGPERAAHEIEQLRGPDDTIFADHLQRAALLSFLLPDHPRAYIPTESRFSEYSRWDQSVDFGALHGLYLAQDDRTIDLGKVFRKVELVEKMHSFRPGGREQTYYIFRVGN
jgi:4-amino-4-deoxy-L-arabinose transferase-like glycosyltransferase